MLLATGPVLAAPWAAQAQQYPDRPVRIVVPYPPGGGVDGPARLLAQQLAAQTSRSFIVENKPGAGGNIGVESVATAPPDGYTLLMSGPNITIAPALVRSTAKFDPLASFTHIGQVVTLSTVIAVKEESPHASLAALVAFARANPGKLTYGVPGTGSPSQLAMELFKRSANVDIRAVPYRGSANALTDLLGGTIDIVPTVASSVAGQIKAKKLRGLAVTSSQRDAQLPDVPTVAETVPGFEAVAWLGLSAPRGLPADVQSWLERQVSQAVRDPALVNTLRGSGMTPAWLDGRQMAAMIGAEADRYRKVIAEANISAE
ncbi:MAG TPA: tripartite tricarboxylate transporter substrate binding protein [Ramlibacter sp.]|nr:tripartite tricarboxylate transporter substrate binding protein [Ramlibacter sp.]